MILNLIREAGPWAWWIAGAIIMVAEIAVPGNVLIWIGLAALVTGLLSNLFWETGWWLWQVQWLIFAALAIVSVYFGRRWVKYSGSTTDEPTLNMRGASMVGRTADLIDPIVNGHGRVRVGDTQWLVEGPDLPSGTKVRITASVGSSLKVEQA